MFNHHALETYETVEVEFHTFLTSHPFTAGTPQDQPARG